LYLVDNPLPIILLPNNNIYAVRTYLAKLEKSVRCIQSIKITLWLYYKWLEQYEFVTEDNLSIEI